MTVLNLLLSLCKKDKLNTIIRILVLVSKKRAKKKRIDSSEIHRENTERRNKNDLLNLQTYTGAISYEYDKR